MISLRYGAARVAMVCRAQQQNAAKAAAAAGVSLPALLAAHPALALVSVDGLKRRGQKGGLLEWEVLSLRRQREAGMQICGLNTKAQLLRNPSAAL